MPLPQANVAPGPPEATMNDILRKEQQMLQPLQQQLADVDSFAGLLESQQPPEKKRMRLDTAHVEMEASAAAASDAAALYVTPHDLGLAVTPEGQPNEAVTALGATDAAELSGLLADTTQHNSTADPTTAGASTASVAVASDVCQQSEIISSVAQSEMTLNGESANAAQASFMREMMALEGPQIQEDNALEQFGLLPPPSVSAMSIAASGLPPEDAAVGAIATSPSAPPLQPGQEAAATSSGTAFTSDPLKALAQLLNALQVPRSCAARQRSSPAADTGLELHDVFALSPLFLWHLLRKRLNEQPGASEANGSGGGARPASPSASLFDLIASNSDFNQQPVALILTMNVRQLQVHLLQLMEALQPLFPEISTSGGASSNAFVPHVVTDRLPHAIPTFATGILRIGSSSPPASTSGSSTGSPGIGALSLEFLEHLPLQTRVLFLNVCSSRAMTVFTKMAAINHQSPNAPPLPIALTPEFVETLSNLSFFNDLNLCTSIHTSNSHENMKICYLVATVVYSIPNV